MTASKLKNKNRIFIILGIGFGLLSFFSPGSLFIIFLVPISVFFINRLQDNTERRFILTLFLSALGARIIATLLLMFLSIVTGNIMNWAEYDLPNCSTPYIIGDSGGYTLRSLFMSMHWLGKPVNPNTVRYISLSYGFSGFLPVLAAFFTVFGYSPVSSRFMNCFLGSLVVILVYSIVKNIFNEKPARLAAILTAFFPSLFLWSTTNLKETSCMLVVCLMLWAMVKFQKSKNVHYLIIAVLSVVAHAYIRYSLKTELLFINIVLILFYIFYLFMPNLALRRKTAIFLIIFIVGSTAAFIKKDELNLAMKKTMQTIYVYHRGVIDTGGICYRLLPDDFYTSFKNLSFSSFFSMLGKGWFHIIFEPLPWNIRSKSMLLVFPQMLLWYFLLPFAIFGVAVSLRYRLRESIFLIMYFLIMTSILAVTGGNIGTIFRLRDINTPIILIFSSIGLFKIFNPHNLKLK